MSTASKTFRARSLTDALAQVREELGPDAVVVRRREGLEGGVAGFFQKAVVEIDALPGGSALESADGRRTSVLDDEAPIVPEPQPAPVQMAPGLARGAAAAGFAAALATAESAPPPPRTSPCATRRCARTSMAPWTRFPRRATRAPRSSRSSPPRRPPSSPSRPCRAR